MCGIIGIIAQRNIVQDLMGALKRLEYRGYDSAGVATLHHNKLERKRAKGKLSALEGLLLKSPLEGFMGIGHTRWATHGAPTESNAHPHMNKRVAVVHNGIIENYQTIKKELQGKGHIFESETDTEVVAHLMLDYLNQNLPAQEAWAKTIKRLEGAFALVAIVENDSETLYCARKGSPLVIGYGNNEMYIGSDAIALAGLTKRIAYLEEGDYAAVTLHNASIYNQEGKNVNRAITESQVSSNTISKGPFCHFMEKEIFEQPTVLQQTLMELVDPVEQKITLPPFPFDWKQVPKITIVACGTSYHAGAVARYWIEKFAKLPVEVDIASEFRYRSALMPKGGVAIFVSQSGETADTLAALRYAREQGQHIIALVNQAESTMAREADVVLKMKVGPEIGVASTKAFTGQLIVLACLTLEIAKILNQISEEESSKRLNEIMQIPAQMGILLSHAKDIQDIAERIKDATDVLFLGRGTSFPIALEGALKLKEISYIHAEGYAAGEMKHGPIALIDEKTPIVVVCPHDDLYEKTLSNVSEAAARGGKIVFLSDKKGILNLKIPALSIELPETTAFTSPLLYVVPLQLLSYYVAVLRGTDVDQPRNLAKSVTVE
jgi:glutamine---fructose-6-phosphate transaminase (isomerizing)